VERALLAARARRAADLLDGRVSDHGLRALAWSVEHARAQPAVDDLAEAMGKTGPAFAATLRREGLPPPSRLLIWGRLLLAGALLADDGKTVEEAAYGVGYASPAGLTRAMKREVGRTPGEIAGGGGLAEVHRALFPPGRTGPWGRGLRLLVLALVALVLGCAGHRPAPGRGTPAADPVQRALDAPLLASVHLGVLVVESESGRTVLGRNTDRRFVPASNQKILTTAAALALLGPDHRWRTALWSSAPLRDGVLEGNLVLMGTGDPTLSSRYWPSGTAALQALADSLRSAGVHRVTGRLVVDVSAWDSAGTPGSWEVGDLSHAYGAGGGAFAVDEGELHAVVRGGDRPGEPASVEAWWPAGRPGFLQSELTTSDADSAMDVVPSYRPESRVLVLRGTVPRGALDTVAVAVRDPVGQAAALLSHALDEGGIEIDGGTAVRWTVGDRPTGAPPGCTGSVPTCPGARALAELRSPPLSEVVQGILGPSQNWMAEQLLRTLGRLAPADPAPSDDDWSRGARVVRGFLTDTVGLDSLAAIPVDGSGLSRHDLVTPRALVAVLQWLRDAGYGPLYRRALASPGEEGSTLEDRLVDLRGHLFAKTGSMSNVDALSGYLIREDGTEVTFAILSNGSGVPAAPMRRALGDLVRALSER
jgi:D-alanyl-D-alanine carboxypeptidase/D-alanyl-D-alanine-endopeptidase (penicillin-binding protein 4)